MVLRDAADEGLIDRRFRGAVSAITGIELTPAFDEKDGELRTMRNPVISFEDGHHT